MNTAIHRELARVAFVISLAFLPITAIAAESATEETECSGTFKGKRPTEEELRKVRESHEVWLNLTPSERVQNDDLRANLCEADLSGSDLSNANLVVANLRGADLRQANLSEAKLFRTDLKNADLSEANLRHADLSEANLRHADLSGADLSRARFFGTVMRGAKFDTAKLKEAHMSEARLSGADLKKADLSGANLVHADLSGTSLWDADLSGANLFLATLSGANLSMADLSGVDLSGADLTQARFNAKPGTLPAGPAWVGTKGLSTMLFVESPSALIELREIFKKAGHRQQEREVTYAIKKPESDPETLEGLFNYLLFDLTTKWGMEPGRALRSLMTLIPFFGVVYWIPLWKPSKDGIWRHWSHERSRADLGGSEPTLLQMRWFSAIFFALYFSLLSAFHVGWRDLNVGNWISRIQPREYTLSASGWVRTVSGIQSLISVYLLAIWVLTYFGRPFE